jgi:serine/threonine protein phosphatase PrpC
MMSDLAAAPSGACERCGQPRAADARFCDACGRDLQGPPLALPPPPAETILLAAGLCAEETARLRALVEGLKGRGFCFAGGLLWPDGAGDLRQQLPTGAARLGTLLDSAAALPADAWLRLLRDLATGLDSLHAAGARLNSLGPDGVVVGPRGYAGLCLPPCLTARDAPGEVVPALGIDGRHAAPEVQGFSDQPITGAADVFGLALLAYRLLTRTLPRDLLASGFQPVDPATLPGPALRELFELALSGDPGARPPSAARFVADLERALTRDVARGAYRFRWSACSDLGLGGRENNEDCCGVWVRVDDGASASSRAAFVVADGMGGAAYGERASACAVEGFLAGPASAFLARGALGQPDEFEAAGRAWAQTLNDAVLELGQRLGVPDGVGTTLTGLLFLGRHALLIHTGDSRAYLLREGQLTQLTADQTLARELFRQGQLSAEELTMGVYRHVLVSHLGTARCTFEVKKLHVQPGDRFVLASDGLVEGLQPAEMVELTGTLPAEEAARALIQRSQDSLRARAVDGPTSDNMTALVVLVEGRV